MDVHYEYEKDISYYADKLAAQLAARQGPDIILGSTELFWNPQKATVQGSFIDRTLYIDRAPDFSREGYSSSLVLVSSREWPIPICATASPATMLL